VLRLLQAKRVRVSRDNQARLLDPSCHISVTSRDRQSVMGFAARLQVHRLRRLSSMTNFQWLRGRDVGSLLVDSPLVSHFGPQRGKCFTANRLIGIGGITICVSEVVLAKPAQNRCGNPRKKPGRYNRPI
jgi:hypothetical protein